MSRYAQIAFTEAVKEWQEKLGSRRACARVEGGSARPDRIGDHERAFIEERDSFYMASISETGWPYLQHRGGPRGFVHILDEHTLAFADLRGNRQYISLGNVSKDDRVSLMFMDYPNRARLKVLAHAATSTDPAVLAQAEIAGEEAERAFVLRVVGLDWNCPQHITPRYTAEELQPLLESLQR